MGARHFGHRTGGTLIHHSHLMPFMRSLSALELIDLWEDGFHRPPFWRALELLTVSCPEMSRESLAQLTIGQRDAWLLALRERLWGSGMAAVEHCPSCRERLEIPLETGALMSMANAEFPEEISVQAGDFTLTFRLPNSGDLLVAAEEEPEGRQNTILERCLLTAEIGEELRDLSGLPEETVAELVERMAEADPLADIQLALTCPACRHQWRANFDIVSFLWTEIEAWAWRALTDVHTLARAYGWSERAILSLSPARRQFYLEMVGA